MESREAVYEEKFRELVKYGHQVMVVCLRTPIRRAGVFHGLWDIRCVSADGRDEQVLVVARQELGGPRPRTFKTLAGIVSFLLTLGLVAVSVPMVEGGRVFLSLVTHGPLPN